MAQVKEHIKAQEKEPSNEEIPNLSGTEFKTLAIRMLTELIEFGQKMKEEMRAIQSEMKENIWGTNSKGKETGTQINGVDQKEKRNIQPEKNEATRIQKKKKKKKKKPMRRGLGTSWTTLNTPTSEL